GTGSVDVVTRLLFILKLAAFAFVLIMALPKINLHNLGEMPLHHFLIISASPVFFTSFGFHVVIPSINRYLDGDVRRLRMAIILGTGIPLIAYILWQMTIHGIFSQVKFVEIITQNPTLNGLSLAVSEVTGSTLIGNVVSIFSILALITSFLGVSLALFDCLDDLLKRINVRTNRLRLGVLTFIPPVFFALFYTDFLNALSYAGQMFTFYGLVLPVGMAWRARKLYPDLPYRVIGGNLSLLIALLLGLLIMNVPFLINWGYLPQVIG
ncbi:MAG TPA: tyrosine transporter, partial [Pasteurellaceae bacterium]|nr:tyrosine transporter [Pasteurellaceae bacterium]